MSGGRGVQRGGGRVFHQSGEADISSKMGELNVQGHPEYVRREPYARYQEKKYKLDTKVSVGKFLY